MTPVMGAVLRVLVVGFVLLVGAIYLLPDPQRPLPPPAVATLLTDYRALPAVRLTDKAGQAFATADLAGQFSLVFFGFTHCPDICPLTLSVLADVRRAWASEHVEPPEVVFVSVDPERDSPGRISDYLANFDSGFRGITGPRDAMDPWLRALGVTVHIQRQPGGQPYAVTHNATVYVVGPGTELLAVFSAPHDAAVIAADFLKIRQHYLNDPSRSSAASTS